MGRKNIQSVYNLSLHLVDKSLLPSSPRPVNLRDLDIYRLHIIEKKDDP
jgi:hypothetical protein